MRGAICDFISRTIPFKPCCCEAANGGAAQKAKERTPDLIILDVTMPTQYGVEIASSVRGVVPDIKIIGLAMFDGEFRKSQLTAAGFDVMVSKQAGLGKLADAINALLPAPPTTN